MTFLYLKIICLQLRALLKYGHGFIGFNYELCKRRVLEDCGPIIPASNPISGTRPVKTIIKVASTAAKPEYATPVRYQMP